MSTTNITKLNVGGKRFDVSPSTLSLLDSTVINRMIDPDSPFQKPEGGVYFIDRDGDLFGLLLNASRNLALEIPPNTTFQAIRNEIEYYDSSTLRNLLQKKQEEEDLKETRLKLQLREEVELERHHNIREGDGQGRIYCSDKGCTFRDMDTRFSKGNYYLTCPFCSRDIYWNGSGCNSCYLGWCHKCGRCDKCQRQICDNCRKDDYWRWKPAFDLQVKRKINTSKDGADSIRI